MKTHMAFRPELPLRGFDLDLRKRLAAAMTEDGVTLHAAAPPIALEKTRRGVLARLANGAEVEVDVVLAATGRRPATAGLGLEQAGARLSGDGAVIVDARARSSAPSIYAVGDVTDRINLTPVAIREGQAFADRLFGGRNIVPTYRDPGTNEDHRSPIALSYGSSMYPETYVIDRKGKITARLSALRIGIPPI